MPAHDAHHRPSAVTTNPFEPSVPRLAEYTAKEIASLQSRLDKQLGPEYISSRPGAGGSKVHYIAAEKVINLANEVFGFNGWSSSIQNVQIDFVDENPSTGKITLGLSTITRVTLKDGTFHEDIGYGAIENCKGKAAAFEKAKKEAATDALKRSLRNFGNVLGNCLYDKDYLGKITKIKVNPSKWDAENLHRHPDFAPTKEPVTDAKGATKEDPLPERRMSRTTEMDDDFGGNLFDEVEMNGVRPDEVALPPSRPQTPRPATPRRHTDMTAPKQSRPPDETEPAPKQVQHPPEANQAQSRAPQAQTLPNNGEKTVPPQPQQRRPAHSTPPEQTIAQVPPDQQNVDQPQPHQQHEPPVGFITGRAAELLHGDNTKVASALPRFDPKAESPSIRKTNGIDHAKSAPIHRTALNSGTDAGNESPAVPPSQAPPANFVNPSDNIQRRIGAPAGGAPMSLHSNRSAYKPPTMSAGVKRPLPANVDGAGHVRPPLADVSNTVGQDTGGEEGKRQRVAQDRGIHES